MNMEDDKKRYVIYWTERNGKVTFAMDTHGNAQLFNKEDMLNHVTNNQCNYISVGVE